MLTVAIDETGKFTEQKLTIGGGRSGVTAVALDQDEAVVAHILRRAAETQGLGYPDDIHARELLEQDSPVRRRLRIPTREAKGRYEAVLATVKNDLRLGQPPRFVVGVHGRVPGATFFHEQQAYGEKLLCLLFLIGHRYGDELASAHSVRLLIASRKHRELVGFTKPEDYHRSLKKYIEQRIAEFGWPEETKVDTDSASTNPYLMVADLLAMEQYHRAGWSELVQDHLLPASFDETVAQLGATDRAAMILYELRHGRDPKGNVLRGLGEQGRFEVLKRLTTAAHAEMSDRYGQGRLEFARKLVDFLWPHCERRNAQHLLPELCSIAAAVYSHMGMHEDEPEVQKWRGRASELGAAWATNSFEARANRLAYRCQTVQIDRFNVFAFTEAYLEFCDHVDEYERAVGGVDGIREPDELYGKLLGTVGQACGFLRPQDPGVGADTWHYLIRSAPHFANSAPLFRAMSVGFRLTDLWDRGEIHAALDLMRDEQLPPASKADAYTLLHRVRVAAAGVERGLPHEDPSKLVQRLLLLLEDEGTDGQTPWDLVLKWALLLDPDNDSLQAAARRWIQGLTQEQPALLATSLPLLVQIGEFDTARQHLDALLRYGGFCSHWDTARARPMARCIEDGQKPDYAALRGMPWNYA